MQAKPFLAAIAAAAAVPGWPVLAQTSTAFVAPGQRIVAATGTAQSGSNACNAIRPFYWEIGDRNTALAAGSVDRPGSIEPAYTADDSMPIASASKWLYAAYVVQKQNGVLSAGDRRFLSFRSGYASLGECHPAQTVDACLDPPGEGTHAPAQDGKFHYGGGHMQKHASLIGLGALDNAALAAELKTQLGNDLTFGFGPPQPAGGAISTASDYARFLRKLLRGQLHIAQMLGSKPVCTAPATCAQASYTPIPATEEWQYSLGHWVESDPIVGDGAYSSAGTFGFYPWVSANRRWYGIVARRDAAGSGHASVQCGRLIRKAWITGIAR